MKTRIITALMTLLFAVSFVFPANAFRVTPMVYDLGTSGQSAITTLRIENTGADSLPVEIYAEKRTIHEDGSESRENASDDFLILPL